MNNTKKLIFALLAGATLGIAAPVFAESFHDRGYDHDRHHEHFRDYDHHGFREHDRYAYRGYEHRAVIVERPYYVQRPVYVEQPVYYSQSGSGLGVGALIGQALGSFYDSRQ